MSTARHEEEKYESKNPHESKGTGDDDQYHNNQYPDDHHHREYNSNVDLQQRDVFYHDGEVGSRPSSQGTAGGGFPSRPSTATSRPNSRSNSRPNSRPSSRQRPYTATSDEGDESYYEDRDDSEMMIDHDGYAYSDIPDSRGGNGSGGGGDDGYDADGRHLFSRGTLDSRGGAMYSRGDSRGTLGTPLGGGFGGMGRPPSGRSSGMGSRPGTMGTVGTSGTMETMETTETSAADNEHDDDNIDDDRNQDQDRRPISSGIRREDDSQRDENTPAFSPSSKQEMDEHEHHAAYVDPSGHFVTDDFLEVLLQERMLNSKVARTKVDALREQVRIKKEAEERARLQREGGGGNENGVQLLKSNAELDGSIQQCFPSSEYLCAKNGVVRRATIAVGQHLGCERNNSLLVRSACPEDNVEIFRSTDWLSFAGPKGYNLGGLGGLPSAGVRGMMACGRLLGNCEHPRIILEYGPVIGISEYGDIGTILRTDKRGSLYQRTPCPTFAQNIYDEVLQAKNDEIDEPHSTSEAKLRAEQQGWNVVDKIMASLNIGSDMKQPIELIKSLIGTNGIVETWARRGRKECLAREMYRGIRQQVLEVIQQFHQVGGNKKRDRYSELTRMSKIPILSIGVIRIRTQIEFDDRIIPMHCEYHRKGRKAKSHLNELESFIDEYWDADSTDAEGEDSEDDAPPPIEGRI